MKAYFHQELRHQIFMLDIHESNLNGKSRKEIWCYFNMDILVIKT